jgi:hypothetical protein
MTAAITIAEVHSAGAVGRRVAILCDECVACIA